MDQTIFHLSSSQYDGEVHEDQRIPRQPLTDNIQLQTNSCYQITNFGMTECHWDKAGNNTVHGAAESILTNSITLTHTLH